MFLCITQRKMVSVLCVVSWFFLQRWARVTFKTSTFKRPPLSDYLYLQSIRLVKQWRWPAALAQVYVGRFVVGTLVEFKQKPKRSLSASQVVVFLLDVSVCVLEAERLDVVGEVSNASVEFLRSWRQGGVVVPAGDSNRLSKCYLVLSDILLPLNLQVRMNLITTGGIHN